MCVGTRLALQGQKKDLHDVGSLNSPNPVAVHQQGFQSSEQGEAVQFSHFVIREVKCVELVERRPEIFNHWNFITCETHKRDLQLVGWL